MFLIQRKDGTGYSIQDTVRIHRDFHPRMFCPVSEVGSPEMQGHRKLAEQWECRCSIINLHSTHIPSLPQYYSSNSRLLHWAVETKNYKVRLKNKPSAQVKLTKNGNF